MKFGKNSKEKLDKEKSEIRLETYVFLMIVIGIIVYLQSIMGIGPLFSTLMKTAYALLIETVLYITAICVLTGAFSALLAEFGVIALLQKIISPIMRPIYGLPGAASLGIITTFLSDNPAILTLTEDEKFVKYFKKYQIPALCNIGTAFGMGLIVVTFMIGLGSEFTVPALIGVGGAVVGSIVSTRLMLIKTKKYYKNLGQVDLMATVEGKEGKMQESTAGEQKSMFGRVLDTMLEGGKSGIKVGVSITPGLLCICTAVMILTFGPGAGPDGMPMYTGAAYEGIAVLPMLGNFISPVTDVLFGFADGGNIAFPITSLGAVGAAMGLVPTMLEQGLAGGNEIAVFTAMGMCWSGYLSTHVSMMDALGKRQFTGHAILAHTIGGIAAGIAAHYLFLMVM